MFINNGAYIHAMHICCFGIVLCCLALLLYLGFRCLKLLEVTKAIENGYDIYVNGQKEDVDQMGMEMLNGKIEINDKNREIYVTFLH